MHGLVLVCKQRFVVEAARLFGVKCAGCLGCIAPSELVMRALEHVFHVACFACVVCGRTLQKGDQFVVRAARLYCRPDFEKEMALVSMAQHHNSQPAQPHAPPQHPAAHAPNAALPGARGENGPLPGGGPNGQQPGSGGGAAAVRPDGRRGPKRPRTILTTAQRRAFKASFEISQKPCRKASGQFRLCCLKRGCTPQASLPPDVRLLFGGFQPSIGHGTRVCKILRAEWLRQARMYREALHLPLLQEHHVASKKKDGESTRDASTTWWTICGKVNYGGSVPNCLRPKAARQVLFTRVVTLLSQNSSGRP
ncbi:hypothetical protein MTO96_018130 [Rhipicephalus appendiculatus]